MEKADVLIVGGGPAGAACARKLSGSGVKTILLDKAKFPRPKLCAGWVTPAVFRSLGVEPAEYPFGLTEFRKFDVSIKGFHFTLPTHQYAIRRYEFDAWLLKDSNVRVIQHEVRQVEFRDGTYFVDDTFCAPILVGAGGTHCPVYQTFFKQASPRDETAWIAALEEEFEYEAEDPRCHLWFFENELPGYAWYVPKSGNFVNVGIGAFANSLKERSSTLKSHWNSLIEKLEREDLVRGHVFQPLGHSYFLRRAEIKPRIENAFLAGDALGLATRDMGEGIGPAILSGQLAAQAILSNETYSVDQIPRYSFPSLLGLRK